MAAGGLQDRDAHQILQKTWASAPPWGRPPRRTPGGHCTPRLPVGAARGWRWRRAFSRRPWRGGWMGDDLRIGIGAFIRAEASTSGCSETTMEGHSDLWRGA